MTELNNSPELKALYGSSQELLFAGLPTFMRRRYTRDLTGVDIAVLGVPCDLATSFRPGARFGPASIRQISADMAWWNKQFHWEFNPFNRLAIVDYGDVNFEYGNPADLVEKTQKDVADIVKSGAETLCLGGDHFITLPVLRELAKVHGPLSLIHFDAHTDTDPHGNTYDHGSMFFHAVQEGLVDPERSVQIGIRTEYYKKDKFVVLSSPWVHEHGISATVSEIKNVVRSNKAYLTFDIDCLDPAFAPGTGTPVMGGLSSDQVLGILRGLTGINFIGMDVVEVSPTYDVGNITSFAAAQIALEYLCLKSVDRKDVV
ncbi:agmatinase [Aliamphritea ceti]|uniref:agmatinase n=1 Tax=Aliamphritea ceti TaxID=1524258 RepID=UPI0021C26328|nr:agmatinase [Aliamphritea ceti]